MGNARVLSPAPPAFAGDYPRAGALVRNLSKLDECAPFLLRLAEMPAPDAYLLTLLHTLPPLLLQNTLMACADRDLAMAMLRFSSVERELLLGRLAPAKRDRVREELTLQRRVRVSEAHYKASLDAVIRRLLAQRGQEPVRSYLRPSRTPRRSRPRRPPRES